MTHQEVKVCISQPRYFPALDYLQRIALADVFVLLDTVQHQPRGYEHRCSIKAKSGREWLSIPIRRTRSRFAITEMTTMPEPWLLQHKGMIKNHYSKAPHWDSGLLDFLFDVPQSENRFTAIAGGILDRISSLLGIKTPRVWASTLTTTSHHDALLAEITRLKNGTTYLSGPKGRNYINRDNFTGLKVLYHHYEWPNYPQLWGNFELGLGCLDSLFNVGVPGTIQLLQKHYHLTE